MCGVQQSDFEGVWLFGGGELLPCEQQPECSRIRNAQIVTDEDAYGCEALYGSEDLLGDDIESGALDEAGEDIDVCSGCDAELQVIPELRFRASGGQRGLGLGFG